MDHVVYPGMEIDCTSPGGNPIFPEGTVVVDINLDQWQVRLSNKPTGVISDPLNNNYQLKFESFNRPLNFQNSSIITGINIIDDFLFWTDNNSEPKKINIRRGKEERILNPYILHSLDFKTHSMLTITDTTSLTPNALMIAEGNMPWSATVLVPLKEEHTAVIRKSPEATLKLEMSNTPRLGEISGQIDYHDTSGRVANLFTNTTLAVSYTHLTLPTNREV